MHPALRNGVVIDHRVRGPLAHGDDQIGMFENLPFGGDKRGAGEGGNVVFFDLQSAGSIDVDGESRPVARLAGVAISGDRQANALGHDLDHVEAIHRQWTAQPAFENVIPDMQDAIAGKVPVADRGDALMQDFGPQRRDDVDMHGIDVIPKAGVMFKLPGLRAEAEGEPVDEQNAGLLAAVWRGKAIRRDVLDIGADQAVHSAAMIFNGMIQRYG